MDIKYLQGNVIHPVGSGTKIIAHVANDSGGWGRGVVLAISDRWPIKNGSSSPEYCYREWYKKGKWKGKPFVLGQIQTIWVEDTTFVCNMVAQRDYKPLEEDGELLHLPNAKLSSLLECFTRLRIVCSNSQNNGTDISVHLPRICMGLGGIKDWSSIEKIINITFGDSKIPVFVYDYQQ